MPSAYNHMALQVADLAAAERFWCDGLGLRKIERPTFGVQGAWLAVGQAQLHLIELEGGTPPAGRLPHVALCVERDELERLAKDLPGSGATELSGLRSRDDNGVEVWTAVFADPDGNVVELTTAPLGL
jgi:glyoxylase I family protein